MATGSCRCRICGDTHKLTVENFPLELWLPPTDKKGNRIPGEPVFSGRACKKCDHKNRRAKFIQEYGIRAEGGRGLDHAIREKEKELKFKSKIVKEIAPKQESRDFFRG
jgi:hypothetical protein